MNARVGTADGGDGRATGNDELVVLADVVGGLRLGKHHVVEVESRNIKYVIYIHMKRNKLVWIYFIDK